jgi:hypothetical protein
MPARRAAAQPWHFGQAGKDQIAEIATQQEYIIIVGHCFLALSRIDV